MVSTLMTLLPLEAWALTVFVLTTLLLYLGYYSLRTRLLKSILEQAPYPWAIVNKSSGRIVLKARGFSKMVQAPIGARASQSLIWGYFDAEEQLKLRNWVLLGAKNKIDIKTQRGVCFRLSKRILTTHLISIWFHDITNDLYTAEVLDAAHSRVKDLESVLDSLPFPVWAHNTSDGKLTYINSAYGKFSGEEKEVVLKKQIHLAKQSKQRTNDLGIKLYPLVVDGSRQLFSFHSTRHQATSLVTSYAHDVTKEEDLSHELKRTMTTTYELLDTLSTGLVIYGPDTRLQYFNHAYVKMFEPLRHMLPGHPTLSEVLDELRRHRLLPEMTDFQDYKRRMLGQFTSLTTPYHDLRYLPNGQIFRVITAPHPLGGLIYMFENITERISLENQYNTLIAVQKATIDNLFEGIAVFSSDNRLKLCNPAFRHIWNLNEEQSVLGRPVAQLMDEAKALFFKGGDWALFRERMIDNITNRIPKSGIIHRLDGRVVDFAYAPLPDGANMVRYIDITDTTQVEMALRERNEALEASDRIKSKFVANVSYELRSPLNTVIGFSEILLQSYFGNINEKQGEYIKGILDASKQLLSLINGILDLASIEAGRTVLQKSTLHVTEVLDRSIDIMQNEIRESGHQLTLEYATQLPPIEGDSWQLQQVFCNLLSNALKFTLPQGQITIRAFTEGAQLAVEVQDTGFGIDEKDHDRIFERFERSHAGKYGGVGLGLSLVKNFMTLHEGTVHVNSQVGSGTTVTCRFPLSAHLKVAS